MARRGAERARHRPRDQAAARWRSCTRIEAATPRIDYREVAVEALAEEQPGRFDVVTCMEMLEHVPDPGVGRRGLRGAWSSPAAGSFFSTINRNAKAFLFAIVGAEHVLKLLPKGTHEYAKFIRPSELPRWCRDAGARAGRRRAAWNTTR